MITLTTPPQVLAVLGGTTMVGYDRFILADITYHTVAMTVSATVHLTSTAQPDMQPIFGTLQINTASGLLTITVPQSDFQRQVRLTGPQNDVVMGFIRSAQNNMEAGLVSLGVIAGAQAPGV